MQLSKCSPRHCEVVTTMPSDYLKLYDIVRRGPLLRGTQEWEDRELARRALGCKCMSHGTVAEALLDNNDWRNSFYTKQRN